MIFTAIQLEIFLCSFFLFIKHLKSLNREVLDFNNKVNAKHFYPFTALRAAKQA